jgi:hypothetical protein
LINVARDRMKFTNWFDKLEKDRRYHIENVQTCEQTLESDEQDVSLVAILSNQINIGKILNNKCHNIYTNLQISKE